MASLFASILGALCVTFLVVGEGSTLTTSCKPVGSPMRQGMNPMTLDIHYCRETQFELNMEKGATSFLTLMDRERIFQYKVTDIRFNFDYFFDKIIFVDEGNKKNYKFLSSTNASPRILMVHQRTIFGAEGYTRYLILGIKLQEQNASTTNRDVSSLISTLEKKENNATFKLNGIFPLEMSMTRYDATVESKTCSGVSPYIFIDFWTPLKLSKEEFAVWKKYPKLDWDVARIDKSHQDMNFVADNGTIRFDCKMGKKIIDNNGDSGANEKFNKGYMNFKFILLAGIVIRTQTEHIILKF